jgi:hypothetical protein
MKGIWQRIAAYTVGALFMGAVGVSAQVYVPQSLERDFRLEWQVTHDKKGPAVEGYVYNTALRNAERMRLQVERLDGDGKVVGSSSVWVLGLVPMNGRVYFRASVPEAARYHVDVLAFDWACGGGGGGGGM